MSGGTQGSRAVLGRAQRPRGTLRRAQREKQRLRPHLCQGGTAALTPAAHATASPRPLSSSRLLVPTPYLSTANQSRTSVLGPVKWSHSTHLAASWSREMQILSSLCVVPGGGAGRAAQASTVHHALRKLTPCSARPPALLCPPGPRSQASYLSVMEARPAGGARRKGATASPGKGGSLPAGDGAACVDGSGCAGRKTTDECIPSGLRPAPGVGGAGG